MKKKLIELIHSYPKTLIGISLCFAFICLLGIKNVEMQHTRDAWFEKGDPLISQYKDFKEKFGSDSSVIMVLKFQDEIYQEKNLIKIHQMTEELWKIPKIKRVDSITNFSHITGTNDEINIHSFIKDPTESPWTQEYLKEMSQTSDQTDIIQNYLISKDKKSVAIYSSFHDLNGRDLKEMRKIVNRIRTELIPKYKSSDLDILLTGSAMIGVTFVEESGKDLVYLVPMAFTILLVILYFLLRNIKAVIFSLGLTFLTLLTTLGIQGHLGIKLDLVVSMCPLIVLAICIADSIHIFSSYLNNTKEKNPLAISLSKNIKPTLLTSITTIVGFSSFMGSNLLPIKNMGILASSGVACAWIYTIFLLCPLLRLSPIKESKGLTKLNISFRPLYHFIIKNPALIILTFSVVTLTSVYFSGKNKIESNMQNYFSKKTQFRIANDFFNENIGGTGSIEILLKAPDEEGILNPYWLKKVDALINKLKKTEGITKIHSVIDPLKQVNQVLKSGKKADYQITDSKEELSQELFFLEMSLPEGRGLDNLLSDDKKHLRLTIFWDKTSSNAIIQGADHINKIIKSYKIDGEVTGLVPMLAGVDKYIVDSFIQSIIISIGLISLLMMIVFRSIFFGILSMIPNIMVPSFGMAALYLTGRPFDVGSILVFSICLGIAIDDTIFFLTNYKKAQSLNTDKRKTIQYVLDSIGETLLFTTIILVSVFGLFYFGAFVPNQNFAIAASIILISALVLDLVLLPSLIYFSDILSLKTLRLRAANFVLRIMNLFS